MTNYYIKKGYQARTEITFLDDTKSYKDNMVHQPDVYELARYVAERTGAQTIVDFGCGIGRKLARFKDDYELIGLDIGSNVEYCKKTYDFGRWYELNFDQPHELPVDDETLAGSVVVCSDVIEHVIHPEHLLHSFQRVSETAKALLVSTPERDLVRGPDDMGPPRNKMHIREWNLNEFVQLCQEYELPLPYSGVTVDNNRDFLKTVSFCIFSGSYALHDNARNGRVVAIVDTFNHGQIIKESLQNLLREGLEVYVIEGGSTDDTKYVVERFGDQLGGFEQYRSAEKNEKSLLNRKREIAKNYPGAWILDLHGNESPTSLSYSLGLRESLGEVAVAGYDNVEFSMIEIFPGASQGGKGPSTSGCDREQFRFSSPEAEMRAWYQPDRAHNQNAPSRGAYPFRFLIKQRSESLPESKPGLVFRYVSKTVSRDFLVEIISGIGNRN